MSYGMPGMQIYGMGPVDAPSGAVDMPISRIGSAIGQPAGHFAVNTSISGDATVALAIFALCYFGAVGSLHWLSNAADKV